MDLNLAPAFSLDCVFNHLENIWKNMCYKYVGSGVKKELWGFVKRDEESLSHWVCGEFWAMQVSNKKKLQFYQP